MKFHKAVFILNGNKKISFSVFSWIVLKALASHYSTGINIYILPLPPTKKPTGQGRRSKSLWASTISILRVCACAPSPCSQYRCPLEGWNGRSSWEKRLSWGSMSLVGERSPQQQGSGDTGGGRDVRGTGQWRSSSRGGRLYAQHHFRVTVCFGMCS